MKRRSWILSGCALALVACGGGGGATPVTPVPSSTAPEMCLPDAPPAACADPGDAGAVSPAKDAALSSLPDAGAVSSEAPLPPPKPSTIALRGKANDAVDVELTAGDAAFEGNDLAGAKKHYEAAKKLDPKRAGPTVGLARVRVAQTGLAYDVGSGKGNAEITLAVKELRAAVAQDDAFGPGHAELGRTLLLAGDPDGALVSLRRASALLPDDAEVHSALGGALLAVGKKDESLAPLQRAAALDPGRAERHGNLGTVLLLMGRVADAVKEYELQVRIAGNDARAHSDLGAALLALPDVPRGTRELERAVQLDATHASYHTNLGYAYQLSGRRADAVREYREALRRDDKFVSALIGLATALAQDPKTRAEARASLEKARTIDPKDPRVGANLEELDDLEKKKP
jgi:tetratricopeptide (TPR) repeat protein